MAVDTKAHFEILADKTVHFLHLAVAILTIKPGFEMGLMVEFHVVGDIKNPNPGHRRFCFQMPSFFHDLRMLRDDVLVAIEAKIHRRDSGIM